MQTSSKQCFQQAIWQAFINGTPLPADTTGQEILTSWHRCRQAGVDPCAGRNDKRLSAQALGALQAKRQDLMQIAGHFMEKLYQFVACSGFVVLLSDEQGYLLASIGDQEIQATEQRLNLKPGASWKEEEVGNNGIGTALVLGRPVQISGCEHFCQKHHALTCSGAPIRDRGKIIGVLEMSGPLVETHLHTLGMVVAAAEAIEQQLRLQRRNREMDLINSQLHSIFRTVSDGMLVVDLAGTINQANPSAETILGQGPAAPTGCAVHTYLDKWPTIRKALNRGRPYRDQELAVQTAKGVVRCLVSARPMHDGGGAVSGGVLFLNPVNRLNTLVNRLHGSHASFTFEHILGEDSAFVQAIDLCRLVAKRDTIVLLQGESGTGKEMVAQAIHNESPRRRGPFVAVNCGAIPRELLASELFGYVEGAFTGARKQGRPGKCELASKGTLFLDEIGDMPLEQQVALLRVLQERSFSRIGSNQTIMLDARNICATHKDLQQEVLRGTFRQDLYYRLNVISIRLPALREHLDDIPLMTGVFLDKLCRKLGVVPMEVRPEVMAQLQRHDWPGNVRELQNILERMVHVAEGERELALHHVPKEVGAGPLPPASPASSQGLAGNLVQERLRIKGLLAAKERDQALVLLYQNKGNVSKTAKALGISRSTLYRRLASWQQMDSTSVTPFPSSGAPPHED